MEETAFLSLGSNLGDRLSHLKEALRRLSEQVTVEAVSSVYETEPVGVSGHPPFLNMACRISCPFPAHELLRLCRGVERRMGRFGKGDRAPRIIDLDILFFGNQVINEPQLQVPHPRLQQRNFVLIPLDEIASDFQDPLTGRTVGRLRRSCPDRSAVVRTALVLDFKRDGGGGSC